MESEFGMNATGLKRNNLFNVIQTVKLNGPMTKPEIALKTGLTSASVHNFVNELLIERLLVEMGDSASTGGRKASLYRFNQTVQYMMGVYIALHSITCCVYDLDFIPIHRTVRQIDLNGDDVQNNINIVLNEINSCIDTSGITRNDIIGIGVTVPGPVNRETGVISSLFGAKSWANIPLKSLIEEATSLQTIVDKDNCGIALHYKWVSKPAGSTNILHISITDGIGSGILKGGELYRGSHYLAGEIGHMSINPDGPKCNCGNMGCLEYYVSNTGIVRTAEERLRAGEQSVLSETIEKTGSIDLQDVINAAKENDSLACTIFYRAAKYIALCLANVIRVIDPDDIVLDCYWMEQLPEMFSMIVNQVFESTQIVTRSDLRISMNTIDDLLIKAAATLQYDEIFSNYRTCLLI